MKSYVLSALSMESLEEMQGTLSSQHGRKLVGPLMGNLCNTDTRLRWRSITGLGMVAEKLFQEDPEGVRWIMRRLIWMLNDESGGIGWGCGEAMGEVMARIPAIAREYHRILVSYMDPEGNHLENPFLQRGVLWGLQRVAELSPVYVQGLEKYLHHYLVSEDAEILAPALMLAQKIGGLDMLSLVEKRKDHAGELLFYKEGDFLGLRISELARETFEILKRRNS
ncbi:hypothetical protein LJC24_03060 [Desulfococcaceae bacterium OttesenSCG-928-F15]|nr:hypothetical protein [Desulfococcaceae bacterium OttesenSCG-928-F15]